jgi:hypothetical protein
MPEYLIGPKGSTEVSQTTSVYGWKVPLTAQQTLVGLPSSHGMDR